MENLEKELKAHNLKLTPQRIAVYAYLKNSKEHPSVEKIYNEIKGEYPKMSIATVYKTVASLTQAGLIQKLNIGDTCRYDADMTFHIHAVCNCCGDVCDYRGGGFDSSLSSSMKESIGFRAEYAQLLIYGRCTKCK